MVTITKPAVQPDELTSDEVKISAPKIMDYLREGTQSSRPELILIIGPEGAGKSTHIKNNYKGTHVWIDMARIFFDLKTITGIRLNRRYQIMNFIGIVTLDLAILEKRNIVMELLGDDLERIDRLIDLMKIQGYDVKITVINSAGESCLTKPYKQDLEHMSSVYTEKFHFDWFERTAA